MTVYFRPFEQVLNELRVQFCINNPWRYDIKVFCDTDQCDIIQSWMARHFTVIGMTNHVFNSPFLFEFWSFEILFECLTHLYKGLCIDSAEIRGLGVISGTAQNWNILDLDNEIVISMWLIAIIFNTVRRSNNPFGMNQCSATELMKISTFGQKRHGRF